MRTYLIRLLEALLDVRSWARTPQREVLEVALELQRLDQRLFEICDSLSLPVDVGKMRENRVPRTVAAELHCIVEMVMAGLGEAVASLLKVAQVTEEEIREEFFEMHDAEFGRRP